MPDQVQQERRLAEKEERLEDRQRNLAMREKLAFTESQREKLEAKREHLEREKEIVQDKREGIERNREMDRPLGSSAGIPMGAYDHARQLGPMDTANSPTFIPSRPTRILYSPGTGAGWVTSAPRGAPDAFYVWMLTYEPLIRGLERRESRGKHYYLLIHTAILTNQRSHADMCLMSLQTGSKTF